MQTDKQSCHTIISYVSQKIQGTEKNYNILVGNAGCFVGIEP
jgi:hypothetical protein